MKFCNAKFHLNFWHSTRTDVFYCRLQGKHDNSNEIIYAICDRIKLRNSIEAQKSGSKTELQTSPLILIFVKLFLPVPKTLRQPVPNWERNKKSCKFLNERKWTIAVLRNEKKTFINHSLTKLFALFSFSCYRNNKVQKNNTATCKMLNERKSTFTGVRKKKLS